MQKLNVLLVSQVSVFILAWLIVLRVLPFDILTRGFFIFFCLIAFVASLLEDAKKKNSIKGDPKQ